MTTKPLKSISNTEQILISNLSTTSKHKCLYVIVFIFVYSYLWVFEEDIRRWHRSLLNPNLDKDHEHVHREQTRFCIWFQSRANMAYQIWPVKWVSITEKTKQKERDRFKYLPRWLYRAVSFFLFNPAHILNFNETHTLSSSSWNQMRRDEQQWTQTVCSSMGALQKVQRCFKTTKSIFLIFFSYGFIYLLEKFVWHHTSLNFVHTRKT